MYAEEYLGEDAYDVSDVTSEETSSYVDTYIKQRRNVIEYNKRMDPSFHRYSCVIDGETKKIETYATPITCNYYIKHAVDGMKCHHKTGSKQEDLYFVVVDTTTTKGPRHLYYYSPEEFERHQFTTIPQNIKENWNIKNMRANLRFNK